VTVSKDFLNLNETELSSSEFNELVTIFQILRKWSKEDKTTPEAEIEPNLDCEP
jgi:hypothetical protein